MDKKPELQQLLFDLFKMQIEFGAYRYGDVLPTLKEASGYLLASVDTVRFAYGRLKREGYILLNAGVGATVHVNYSEEETQRHIQRYFSSRREPLLAFAQCVGLLTDHAQWLALKRAAPEVLDELERICLQKEIVPVYKLSRQLQLIYGPLGNDLLLRLFWQMLLFFQAPLVSVPRNAQVINGRNSPLLGMIRSVRMQDWAALWEAGDWTRAQYFDGLSSFLSGSIAPIADVKQLDFTWSVYKKTSQVCYTLCLELLIGMHDGRYPVGSFLPAPRELAQEKKAGEKTIRRAILLLNRLGAAASINGIGTKVLAPSKCAPNCDFSDATVQRRLLDFLYSFHLLMLSCRTCARRTIESMEAGDISRWRAQLEAAGRDKTYDRLFYVCYRTLAAHAPYPPVRTVYKELIRQLFWGFPLRRPGGWEEAESLYRPPLEALIDCLGRSDAECFAVRFEALQIAETHRLIRRMVALGIDRAGLLLVPGGTD